jgi:hypothetical protein
MLGLDLNEREWVLRGQARGGLRASGPTRGAGARRVSSACRVWEDRLGQQRPAAKGRGECVVVNPRREFRRSDVELGWKIGCGGAAQAVAAARKCLAGLMVGMGRGFSGVVGVLFRTGLGVSATQMQRSMGVAANKSQRQEDDQASDP